MKGLFLHGFYSSLGNMKLFLLFVLAAACTLLIIGSPTAQELFVYISVTAFSLNAIVSVRKDAASRWSKYELTFPMRRKEILQCKYLSYLFWVAIGTVLALVVTFMATLLHKNPTSSLPSMFALGIGISLLCGGFFYPFSYLVGLEKSETTLIFSLLLAIGTTTGMLQLLNHFVSVSSLRMVLFIGFYLLFFGLSYLLARFIYARKEF